MTTMCRIHIVASRFIESKGPHKRPSHRAGSTKDSIPDISVAMPTSRSLSRNFAFNRKNVIDFRVSQSAQCAHYNLRLIPAINVTRKGPQKRDCAGTPGEQRGKRHIWSSATCMHVKGTTGPRVRLRSFAIAQYRHQPAIRVRPRRQPNGQSSFCSFRESILRNARQCGKIRPHRNQGSINMNDRGHTRGSS
jgi:hypothetical protein